MAGQNSGDFITAIKGSGSFCRQRATMVGMTTARALLGALRSDRYHPHVPHCFTCRVELLPDDLVEFVTPAWATVAGVPLVLWHANENCATSSYVMTYLRVIRRD